jgi:phosphoglycolate phosphatase
MTVVLFWDIDGTLLTTARAGIFAWEEAFQEVLGRELDMSGYKTAGLTDAEIALKLADGDTGAASRMLLRYEDLLPDRLHRRQGHVLPNVRENLEALKGRHDVVNMLLTGNVEGGARAKLRHYDLWDFFAATGGAFSVEGSDRPSIARAARALITTPYDGDRTYVIGDTPHDVSCGKAIGARTVAVATGPSYDLAALRATDPWVALEALPEPEAFQALVLA